jgi:signal transduction histidine kinase
MKKWLKIILFLLSGFSVAAQDKIVTITPAMFNPINEILICTQDGWLFREGHDTAWAAREINTNGWKKIRPAELSPKMADNDGRLEGWLRFKFKLDNSFDTLGLSLRYYAWAAAEVYVDGDLFGKYGNTGTNGGVFQEFNPSNIMPIPVLLQTGIEHSIAIHLVDYISPLSPKELKSATTNPEMLLRITGPDYGVRFAKHIREWPLYSTFWLSVGAVLSILFWLLAFMNRKEKNLWLFAVSATLFTLANACKVAAESNHIPFVVHKLYVWGFLLLNMLSSCVTIIIVAKVFKQKISRRLKAFLLLFFVVSVFSWKIDESSTFLLINTIPIVIYLWYIITAWKNLTGAQWAIVVGILLTLLFTVLYAVMNVIYRTAFIPYNMQIATCLVLALPLSFLVYISLRFKEIINEVRQNAQKVLQLSEEKKEQALKQQTILEEEVARQTIELRTSLENLKSTQSQLIQSEKMASLGELTAGIAHEIQNPLNFVNNFSEVSNELIDEMNAELEKGDLEEARAIATDVKQNLEKITHHGKRADAIVKGMLQHSRSSNGIKEPTDINVLADEYLRLAYHGLRAKDKSFNATIKTEYDQSIGNISIIPQDIGRALLNLITNAFYAVDEKRNLQPGGYEPTVSVSTKKLNDRVEIRVKDNGNGIPGKALDKIFQPFFTTKPTGKGTGLGLSLTYDIVKAHGGNLMVETKEGEGAWFVITLPI